MLVSSHRSSVSSVNAGGFLQRQYLWPSFLERALHLEVFCTSALPPGISESSRATVNDDQTSYRGNQRGNRVSMKGTASPANGQSLEENTGSSSSSKSCQCWESKRSCGRYGLKKLLFGMCCVRKVKRNLPLYTAYSSVGFFLPFLYKNAFFFNFPG